LLLASRPRLVLQLGLFSFAALVASLPIDFAPVLAKPLASTNLVGLAALAYLVVGAALSQNPKIALLGAGAAMIAGGVLRQSQPDWFHWAAQAGLIYFLLHSLRWSDNTHSGAKLARWIGAAAWMFHSFAWVRHGATFSQTLLVAGAVLTVWTSFVLIRRTWPPLALPVAAGLVALCSPVNFLIVQTQAAPTGLLYVVGSFALFGLGTIVALTKHRWHKHQP
jgi:hypothetical protein